MIALFGTAVVNDPEFDTAPSESVSEIEMVRSPVNAFGLESLYKIVLSAASYSAKVPVPMSVNVVVPLPEIVIGPEAVWLTPLLAERRVS